MKDLGNYEAQVTNRVSVKRAESILLADKRKRNYERFRKLLRFRLTIKSL